jgi:hypothetical protein
MRTPHFAHAPGAECATANETALHLAAKQLIQERMTFFFPALVASVDEVDARSRVHHASKELRSAGLRRLLQVDLECTVSAIRPDALAQVTDDGSIAIEIAVTHFSDAAKRDAFAELRLPAIEVDLSSVRDATFEQIEKLLFDGCSKSSWLYHPDLAPAEAELRDTLQDALAQARARDVADQQARMAQRAQDNAGYRREVLERERQAIRAKIEREEADAAQREHDESMRAKATAFKAASEDEKRAILQRWLNADELPASLLVQTKIRESFGMRDPHVWQTSLFMGLVHRRPAKGLFLLTLDTAARWMRDRFEGSGYLDDRDDLALREYMFALAAKEALVVQRQGYFYTGVADLASFDGLLELRKHAGLDLSLFESRLKWVELEEWPAGNQPTVIALVMSRAPSLRGPWAKLTTIGTGVRRFTPRQACQRAASLGLDEATTLEYLVRAGYVRFAA